MSTGARAAIPMSYRTLAESWRAYELNQCDAQLLHGGRCQAAGHSITEGQRLCWLHTMSVRAGARNIADVMGENDVKAKIGRGDSSRPKSPDRS